MYFFQRRAGFFGAGVTLDERKRVFFAVLGRAQGEDKRAAFAGGERSLDLEGGDGVPEASASPGQAFLPQRLRMFFALVEADKGFFIAIEGFERLASRQEGGVGPVYVVPAAFVVGEAPQVFAGKDGVALRLGPGLDEEFVELAVFIRGEAEQLFDVSGHVQAARPAALVGQG